jgi:hypothetical protein
MVTIPSFCLGGIHSLIGVPDKQLSILAIRGNSRYANARGHRYVNILNLNRLRDSIKYSLYRLCQIIARMVIPQDENELISTYACNGISGAQI